MQERPPPRNVILCVHNELGRKECATSTHMLEYTPGNRIPFLTPGTDVDEFATDAASSSLKGTSTSNEGRVAREEESHRSGRHSLASSPHIPRWRFAARMEMIVQVPFGSTADDVNPPDREWGGKWKGRVVALVAL
jgi:hypothetical protein